MARQMAKSETRIVEKMEQQNSEMKTQISELKSQNSELETRVMEKMDTQHEQVIQTISAPSHDKKNSKRKRAAKHNCQMDQPPSKKGQNGRFGEGSSSDIAATAAPPGSTHSSATDSRGTSLSEQTATEVTTDPAVVRPEITFKKSAKTVAEVANEFFFDENCVRNLEKRCKEEKIKWAKSNLQRQYIMKKKPLVSYIEGK